LSSEATPVKSYSAESFYAYPGMTVAIVEIPKEDKLPVPGDKLIIDSTDFKVMGYAQGAQMFHIDGTRSTRIHLIVHKL